jgi:hypothetical protein
VENYAWIELVFFFGIAIGFGLWQYFKMGRELKQTRAERARREAQETEAKPANKTGSDTGHP